MIDIAYFGYGAGLVMLGWFMGICIKIVFSIFGKISSL